MRLKSVEQKKWARLVLDSYTKRLVLIPKVGWLFHHHLPSSSFHLHFHLNLPTSSISAHCADHGTLTSSYQYPLPMPKRSPPHTRASAEAVSKAHKAPPDDSPCAHKEGSLFEFGQSPFNLSPLNDLLPTTLTNTTRTLRTLIASHGVHLFDRANTFN